MRKSLFWFANKSDCCFPSLRLLCMKELTDVACELWNSEMTVCDSIPYRKLHHRSIRRRREEEWVREGFRRREMESKKRTKEKKWWPGSSLCLCCWCRVFQSRVIHFLFHALSSLLSLPPLLLLIHPQPDATVFCFRSRAFISWPFQTFLLLSSCPLLVPDLPPLSLSSRIALYQPSSPESPSHSDLARKGIYNQANEMTFDEWVVWMICSELEAAAVNHCTCDAGSQSKAGRKLHSHLILVTLLSG